MDLIFKDFPFFDKRTRCYNPICAVRKDLQTFLILTIYTWHWTYYEHVVCTHSDMLRRKSYFLDNGNAMIPFIVRTHTHRHHIHNCCVFDPFIHVARRRCRITKLSNRKEYILLWFTSPVVMELIPTTERQHEIKKTLTKRSKRALVKHANNKKKNRKNYPLKRSL